MRDISVIPEPVFFGLLLAGIIFVVGSWAGDDQGCGKNIPDGSIKYVDLCKVMHHPSHAALIARR